jgi:hypothetical protein
MQNVLKGKGRKMKAARLCHARKNEDLEETETNVEREYTDKKTYLEMKLKFN